MERARSRVLFLQSWWDLWWHEISVTIFVFFSVELFKKFLLTKHLDCSWWTGPVIVLIDTSLKRWFKLKFYFKIFISFLEHWISISLKNITFLERTDFYIFQIFFHISLPPLIILKTRLFHFEKKKHHKSLQSHYGFD